VERGTVPLGLESSVRAVVAGGRHSSRSVVEVEVDLADVLALRLAREDVTEPGAERGHGPDDEHAGPRSGPVGSPSWSRPHRSSMNAEVKSETSNTPAYRRGMTPKIGCLISICRKSAA